MGASGLLHGAAQRGWRDPHPAPRGADGSARAARARRPGTAIRVGREAGSGHGSRRGGARAGARAAGTAEERAAACGRGRARRGQSHAVERRPRRRLQRGGGCRCGPDCSGASGLGGAGALARAAAGTSAGARGNSRRVMIPIDHQPPGYWATNLYTSPRKRPKSEAPIKDLPQRAAQRFKKAREGMRALKHVTEQVVFMGTAWKWVWMYEVGGRKALRQAIRDGAVASGVRWCWMQFPDLDAVDAFVEIVRLKHQFLARPE